MGAELAFEDFTIGRRGSHGPCLVTADEIKAFARDFDPQPFHLDEEAARDTLLGGLAASGWHSCAMLMRLLYDGVLARSTSMGSPGVDEVRWMKPVRPGDALMFHYEVIDARRSRSKPEMGLVTLACSLVNASDVRVMMLTSTIMFGVRGAA